jgi:hypothetical protein
MDAVRFPHRAWTLLALGALLLPAACGDETSTGPPPEEFPGVWVATESEFVRVASPSARVDLVALGGSVVLVLRPNETFALDLTLPGEPRPWRREGIWFDEGDVLRLEYQVGGGGVNEFDMDWRDNVLRLSGADSWFDFGSGGEAAKWNLRMVKATSP